MEFYVKFAIFSILKWNFQNINAVIAGLYINSTEKAGSDLQGLHLPMT